MSEALGFEHRFVPATEGPDSSKPVLLLLHGTGGDENNLLSLGRTLSPGSALLSPRGQVNEGGALRFFRGIREGVFDQEDLSRRTIELAEFIAAAAKRYRFQTDDVVAVGFSNGANIAGSLLLRRPGLVKRAALLSPMIPFEPETKPDLRGTSVFIGAGRMDAMVPIEQSERLAALLRECGAEVAIHWDVGGHVITPGEVKAAQRWIAPSGETGAD